MTTADEFEEYMIAADLTLYSNPLNAALLDSATKRSNSNASSSPSKEEKGSEGSKTSEVDLEKMIASDMTKYDSPLSELDVAALKKDANHSTGVHAAFPRKTSSEKTPDPVKSPSKSQ